VLILNRAPLTARLASSNEHKLNELRSALPDWEIELLGAAGYPEETGRTYYENARAKAAFGREMHRGDDLLLGEDSGLEVHALGGRPGIASARWAEDPIARVLTELDGVADRRARYVCELVCLTPQGKELRGTGVLEGRIAEEPRGSEGFGYDPVFIPVSHERTVAELGNEWKSSNSHRARAAAALVKVLRQSGDV
jgi:XTP/dITP diphosphohydrolase